MYIVQVIICGILPSDKLMSCRVGDAN